MIRTSTKRSPRQTSSRLSVLAALAIGLVSTAVFGVGCESGTSAFCVARCECQGCSEQEREDCTDDLEDAQKYAEYDGCSDAFEAYVNCYADEGTCESSSWITYACTVKGSTLRDCSSRASQFVKTACQEEKAKREACGLWGGGSVPCGGVDECVAFCALSASCSDLENPQSGSRYVNCVLGCSSSSSSSSGGSTGAGP